MNVDASIIIGKLTEKISELILQNAVLQAQVDVLKKEVNNNVAKGPTGINHGDVDEGAGSES